ncbi:transposase, partial [Myxococcota bacterium]|nr:transposase [Myxococcota bacterium]
MVIKKTPIAKERENEENQKKRELFRLFQLLLDGKRLIFIDESGYRLGGTPRYGWSPIGKDAYGSHIQGNWTMMTMIGAMSLDGFRGFMNIDSGTSKDVFIAFIKEI